MCLGVGGEPTPTECLLWAGSAVMKIQQEGAHSPRETGPLRTVTAQGGQGHDGKAPGSSGWSPEEAPNLVGEGESEAGEEGFEGTLAVGSARERWAQP